MRLRSLDSVRGLAALAVVLGHCLLILPGWSEDRTSLLLQGFHAQRAWIYLTPLRLLVAGPAAVLVFFVLSGLVLAMTFVERDGERYPPFLAKRVTRIWLPFALAILGSAALMLALGHAPLAGVRDWFNETWKPPLGAKMLAKHLAMTGTAYWLDLPMWSLVHEMRISLVFPALVALTLWNWRMALFASVALAAIATKAVGLHTHEDTVRSLIKTLQYLFLFVGGIVAAMRIRPLRRRLERLPGWGRGLLWLLALGALCLAPETTETIYLMRDVVLLYVAGAGAWLLVVMATVEGRGMRVLLGPIPSYLGRISYSLYLTHVIVLVSLVRALHGYAPVWVLLVPGVALSIVTADLMQRFVERPTTEFGRALARRLARKPDPALAAAVESP